MDTTEEFAIGLDLGGTKILAALIDGSGRMLTRIEYRTRSEQGESAVLERVFTAIQAVLDENKTNFKQIRGVGIATAGVIDSKNNILVFSSNLRWNNVPIGSLINERFRLPVRLSNDANAAAIAEWIWGAGIGKQHLIYITISTGIGAGIISGGHLITGITDNAGEIGHISVDLDGPICRCGNRGCLENYASGTAIAQFAKQQLMDGAESIFFNDESFERIAAKDLAKAAESGDPFAIDIFKRAGYYLGAGITNLIHIFNPEMIVFGGGVMNAAHILLPVITQTVKQRCIGAMAKQVTYQKSFLGAEAGVIGAAGLFFHNY